MSCKTPLKAALLSLALATAGAQAADDPAAFVAFVQEPGATCVARSGLQVLVRNTHPTRTLRVWLDRFHMGVATADRSRSDLAPGAEPEPLGCSRTDSGAQEWRVVRVIWVD